MPTAKARQLMTLLSGLDVTELTSPELTGEWEHKLKQIEQGGLGREAFMREIAQMTRSSSSAPRNTSATPCRATTPRCARPARSAAPW